MLASIVVLFVALIYSFVNTWWSQWKGVKFFLYNQISHQDYFSEVFCFAWGNHSLQFSIGISIMVTYSSYLIKKKSLTKSAITIVGKFIGFHLFWQVLLIFPAYFHSDGATVRPWITILSYYHPVFSQNPHSVDFLTVFLALFHFCGH